MECCRLFHRCRGMCGVELFPHCPMGRSGRYRRALYFAADHDGAARRHPDAQIVPGAPGADHMTNVVLGHCYTTENKGDAGIVIATIETIKAQSPGVRLKGISTFSSRDDAFVHHHEDYKAAGAEMVPALLPEDKLYLFGRIFTSPL